MDRVDSLRNRSSANGAAVFIPRDCLACKERRRREMEQSVVTMPPNQISSSSSLSHSARRWTAVLRYRRWIWPLLLFAAVLAVLFLLLPRSEQNLSEFLPRMLDGSDVANVPCLQVHSDAESALQRASSRQCKADIAKAACRNEAKTLHPGKMKNLCPTRMDEDSRGRYLGCFSDSFSDRIFQGVMYKLKEDNTAEKCLALCTEAAYSYAGLQYAVECFCGNEAPDSERKTSGGEEECDKVCPGNPSQKCGGYLTMNVYQTGKFQVTPDAEEGEEEESNTGPARIVYLLTVNGRSVRQVRRLIKMIYHQDNYLFIHVDARQDYMFRELSKLEEEYKNIRMAQKRFATIWGGASLLQMHLSCIRELLQDINWQWDYVLNLSESDYPLKVPEKLIEFLTSKKGKNFVKSHGGDTSGFVRRQGLDQTFFQCDNHMWRLGPRKLPLGIQIDGGSDWVCLHKNFARYAVEGNDGFIDALREYYHYALLPAESFYHVALKNSPFCSSVINNNLHLTNWKRKQGCKCQHKTVVDWCGCSPNDFTSEDWKRINGTWKKDTFFGRKFEPIVNQKIVNKVDEWLLGKDYDFAMDARNGYWENIYHYEDISPKPRPEMLSLAEALSRRHSDQLKIGMTFQRILKVTAYNHKDTLEGILIFYEASHGNRDIIRMEVLVKPNSFVVESDKFSFSVGTDFDPKELLFRNKFGSAGPHSDLDVLCQRKGVNKDKNGWDPLTFLAIDPSGELVHVVEEKTLDNETHADVVKLSLEKPTRTGVWTLLVVPGNDKGEEKEEGSSSSSLVLAKIPFLVTPLLPSSGKFSDMALLRLHAGFSTVNKTWEKDYSSVLKVAFPGDTSSRKSVAQEEARYLGSRLLERTKSLTEKFYTIKGSCLHSGKDSFVKASTRLPPDCFSSVKWSSFARDPKSTIHGVDQRTGKLF